MQGLPLAVWACGARPASHPNRTAAALAAQLRSDTARAAHPHPSNQEHLITTDLATASAIADLPATAARLLWLLPAHPGPDCTIPAAAALLGTDEATATSALDALTDAHLAEVDDAAGRGDRYVLFGPATTPAARTAARIAAGAVDDAGLEEAFGRLTDHLLQCAAEADRAVLPGRMRIAAQPESGVAALSRQEGLDWLDGELGTLLAVQAGCAERGRHEAVWSLADFLWLLFVHHKHYRSWIQAYQAGVEAAQAAGDDRAQAWMLRGLASARLNLHQPAEAAALADRALALLGQGREAGEVAAVLEVAGLARLSTGEPGEAVEVFGRALEIHQRMGRARGTAMMHRQLGAAHHRLGDQGIARTHLTTAAAFFTTTDDLYNLARIGLLLARTHLADGAPAQARPLLDLAHDQAEHASAPHLRARILQARADTATDPAASRADLESALRLFLELDAPEAAPLAAALSAAPA